MLTLAPVVLRERVRETAFETSIWRLKPIHADAANWKRTCNMAKKHKLRT